MLWVRVSMFNGVSRCRSEGVLCVVSFFSNSGHGWSKCEEIEVGFVLNRGTCDLRTEEVWSGRCMNHASPSIMKE